MVKTKERALSRLLNDCVHRNSGNYDLYVHRTGGGISVQADFFLNVSAVRILVNGTQNARGPNMSHAPQIPSRMSTIESRWWDAKWRM